jgi:hypothetical protein
MFFSLGVFLLLLFAVALISIIFDKNVFNLNEIIIMVFVMLIFEVVFIPMQINTYSPINVDEGGLYTKIFPLNFKWHFIPWNEIEEITLSSAPGIPWNPVWVVRVAEMNFWYKLQSKQYRQGYHPCIIIHPQISDSDELVEIIKERISKNREL